MHIGCYESRRVENATVNMGFGGKVDYCVEAIFIKKTGQEICVVDAPVSKRVVRGIFDGGQVGQVAGIGQSIQVHISGLRVSADRMQQVV